LHIFRVIFVVVIFVFCSWWPGKELSARHT